MRKIKPFPLKKGDNISIIAPSFHFKKRNFFSALKFLKGFCLNPVYSQDIFLKDEYFAGTNERRAEEIIRAFNDEEKKAIWCVRGGFGAVKILDALKTNIKKIQPFVFLGFSDITAIHLFLNKFFNMVTFYSPNLNTLLKITEKSRKITKKIIFGSNINEIYSLIRLSTLREGEEEGEIVGGNLSVVSSLMSTPYEPCLDGKILFLEDYGEKAYRIDRMLTQICLHKEFSKLKGIVFGEVIAERGEERKIKWVIENFSKKANFPIFYGLPCGHGRRNIPLPLNIKVRISSTEKKIIFLESAFCE